MITCELCGHVSRLGSIRAQYACQAPHCPVRNQPRCWNCLVQKLGARTDALGQPAACPTCGVGELKYLGNH